MIDGGGSNKLTRCSFSHIHSIIEYKEEIIVRTEHVRTHISKDDISTIRYIIQNIALSSFVCDAQYSVWMPDDRYDVIYYFRWCWV